MMRWTQKLSHLTLLSLHWGNVAKHTAVKTTILMFLTHHRGMVKGNVYASFQPSSCCRARKADTKSLLVSKRHRSPVIVPDSKCLQSFVTFCTVTELSSQWDEILCPFSKSPCCEAKVDEKSLTIFFTTVLGSKGRRWQKSLPRSVHVFSWQSRKQLGVWTGCVKETQFARCDVKSQRRLSNIIQRDLPPILLFWHSLTAHKRHKKSSEVWFFSIHYLFLSILLNNTDY